ncbi:MAG TPA: hypothetical protein VK927_05825, partial [Adhaeribacter sp.]|nr:hypothetical protein [Adhaeribacter sp.]
GTGTTITMKLEAGNDKFCLTVADDGPGFSTDTDSRSFGLDLVRSLVKQLGGTSENHFENGTYWRICFS